MVAQGEATIYDDFTIPPLMEASSVVMLMQFGQVFGGSMFVQFLHRVFVFVLRLVA